jgi:hypothetical protein
MSGIAVVRRTLLGLSSVALTACATTPVLKPEPGDSIAPGTKLVQTDVSGVQLQVGGDSWKGDPPNLGTLFTPVKVSIVNQSGKALRVSYADFSLNGSSGFKYSAIPPMSAKGQISQAPSQNGLRTQLALYQPLDSSDLSGRVMLAGWSHHYDHDHFYIAPHYSSFYPGWGVWPYAYPYDPLYYDSLYANWPEQLPTQDMLSEGLPEGVVQNGGKVSGFVYFQSVAKRESSVTFTMNLVDATNNQSFGQVTIPFEVSK